MLLYMKMLKTRKRQIFIIAICVVLLICFAIVAYLDSNLYYSKLLMNAIHSENTEKAAEILHKKPSCVNVYSGPPALVESFAELRITEYPIGEACATGNVEMVKILVENGADVNLGKVKTPLCRIYSTKPPNWYEISIYLIEKGAILDYSNKDYENVLTNILESRSGYYHYCGPENNDEVISSFYYALENCDHSKIFWPQVLRHSVIYDRIEIVKFLLDVGYCGVNDAIDDMRALMFAAMNSTPKMVQLLLDYGADKSVKDEDGMTAYDYAIKSEEYDNADLLKP